MILKNFFRLIFIVFIVQFTSRHVLYGQSYFQGSLQSQNGYIDNIASAGIFKKDIYNISYRNQWTGFEQRPQWMSFNASLPLYRWKGGLGFSFEQLNIGIEKDIFASASYNYIYKLGDGVISAGFSLGISQVRLEGSRIRTPQGEYQNQVINHNDGWLPTDTKNSIKPVFGSAVYYLGPIGLIGLSVKNIAPIKYELTDIGRYSKSPVIILSYQQKFGFDNFQIIPEGRIKSDLVQTQTDIGVNIRWADNILLGTSFRGYSKSSIDALIIKGGVSINNNIILYYAYDYPLSKLGQWSGFVHELLLKIQINHPDRGQYQFPKVYNPRML